MRIKALLKALKLKIPAGLEDFPVAGISSNSKNVKNNFIFVAVKGYKADGNKFIAEAVKNGARAIIFQGSGFRVQGSGNAVLIKVRDTRRVLGELAAEFYNHPDKEVKVVGVTGTNGKTTITFLLEKILAKAKESSGVIGTINYRFKGKNILAKNTTPGPIEIQSLLFQMRAAQVHYCLMEVSSHALDQQRVRGINFHSAIFTNLTQDHLDYHKTMKNYFKSKQRLFQDLGAGSFALINNDSPYAAELKKSTRAKVITYGLENKAQVMARNIKFDCTSSGFDLIAPGIEERVVTGLIGRHNIYNALACIAWSLQEGIDLALIKEAVKDFACAPGRLEGVAIKKDFRVFVDYAHTEDALKNVLQCLRQLTEKRLIVVFGCGGERDKLKRPKMGRVVSELSDLAIITSDNPRSEDPGKIIRDIEAGIAKDNYRVVPARQKAIKESLKLAAPGDIVLIAGKGHENYQIIKDSSVAFDDRKVVMECLKLLN